jgi:hypothetical protein
METAWAAAEMAGAGVWDRRCRRSLTTICERLAEHPEASFSAAVGEAARQAAHRIFDHESSTPARLLAGHVAQTALRCQEHPLLLVAQDTSSYNYASHPAKQGLGPIERHPNSRGLFVHSALAMTQQGEPLGLLHLECWRRNPEEHGKNLARKQRPGTDKESQKWLTALEAIEAALPPEPRVLVIADREADCFPYLAAERRSNTHLLVRACQPRRVLVPKPGEPDSTASLLEVAAGTPAGGELVVEVRTKAARTGEPRRRAATLQVRVTPVRVLRPAHLGDAAGPAHLELWVVRATEENPPPGEAAVDWVLLTTWAVTGEADALALVGYYARRWLIERLHFVLKSGFRVERLQIDTFDRLQNALAIYHVVAWRLLWLTYVARTAPEAPASQGFSPEELAVLEQVEGQPTLTLRASVRAAAKLGGFVPYPAAGEPGVKSLWLGLRRLHDMAEGWRLALAALRYATR